MRVKVEVNPTEGEKFKVRLSSSSLGPHSIVGEAGERVISNSVPKVEAAFLTMGKACVL